ncbi:hypothetical protein DIPPA_23919 [Diplonema papillatum]|nr:hypothetical protein DIPPA_23919 [Diplonema papillatum]
MHLAALTLLLAIPAAAGFETMTPDDLVLCSGAGGCLLTCDHATACSNTEMVCAGGKPCWIACTVPGACTDLRVACPTTASCTVKCAAGACPPHFPHEVDCFGPGCPAGSAGDYDAAPGPFGPASPFGLPYCAFDAPSLPPGAVVEGYGCEPNNFVPAFGSCKIVKDGRFCESPVCWFGRLYGLADIQCNECLHKSPTTIPRYFVQCEDGSVCDYGAHGAECCDEIVRCPEGTRLCANESPACGGSRCCSFDCSHDGGEAPCPADSQH